MSAGSYTDAESGIKFKTWAATDGAPYTFGLALPSDALTKDATEYIGLLVSHKPKKLSPLASLCSRWTSAARSPMPPTPDTAVSPTASPAR